MRSQNRHESSEVGGVRVCEKSTSSSSALTRRSRIFCPPTSDSDSTSIDASCTLRVMRLDSAALGFSIPHAAREVPRTLDQQLVPFFATSGLHRCLDFMHQLSHVEFSINKVILPASIWTSRGCR